MYTVLHSGVDFENLKGNFIQEIDLAAFSGLSSLKTLDLSHQNIFNVSRNAFLGLRSLLHLDLSHNYLKNLNEGVFNGLDKLFSLDLTYNKVTHMESRVFVGLTMLKKLHSDEFRFCCLATHVVECYPEPDEFSSCEDLMSNIVLRVCIWFLGVLALTGNMLVIVWRCVHRINNKVHSFLITNLAIGDMLMGIYLLIIAAVDFYYRGIYFIYASYWKHSLLCQFSGFLSTLSSELSVSTLTIITLDRFLCIIFPFRMRRLSTKQTSFIMAGVWTVVLLLAGVPLMPINYFSNFYGRSGVCLALHITPERPHGWEYSVSVFLALNFISFTFIALAYGWMFGVAKKSRTTVRSRDSRADATMARKMTIIVVTDFCCWMPIIVLGIASLSGATIPRQVCNIADIETQYLIKYTTELIQNNTSSGKSVSGSLHHNKDNCLHDEEFHCMDSEVCVLETSLCDGVSDCPKGDDESSLICGISDSTTRTWTI
ncbi:G-protein coupled receptor GRL101-like [Tachypleus tridentatus]|uniref:G-protein coupled receptor GRL101-like n=1 Tax=Tachypleus tridentatus TaxID=6853 RepID=UPI003FD18E73